MIETDILIIGAGPVGLFTVFEAGLLKLRCHLVDVLPQVGGQLTEVYPKKPIYDIPGFPSILAGDLVDNLMKQIEPFHPTFTLGERVETLEKQADEKFIVTTHKGTQIHASAIFTAAGLGCVEPKRPPIANIRDFEEKGVDYMVRNPEKYRDKTVVISGGGDSALDWTIFLADVAKKVTIVHRRDSFRGHLDSVQKVMDLANAGKINVVTEAEIVGVNGSENLQEVTLKKNSGEELKLATEYWLPLYGLSPQLGPIANWGLNIDKKSIVVNTDDYSTNVKGIFAVGDINEYTGKLKLILCGFHEATLAVQSAFAICYPDKKKHFKYTTVAGIEEF
ncbi:MAG TPA: NAD(P)/FAD-dependent oxidoreductase [Chitinophagales bacterium]